MLRSATSGVLALTGADGYPYAVPLSFAYQDGRLYFHSADAGAKIDAIAHDDRASFCVIAEDDVVPSAFTTRFRSVIVFGRMRLLAGDLERRGALLALAEKYSPSFMEQADAEIDQSWERVTALELVIEEMTGKAGLEIVKAREGASRAEGQHPLDGQERPQAS